MTYYRKVFGLAVVCSLILWSLTSWADEVPCDSDADCDENEFCLVLPCAVPPCDPDDSSCDDWGWECPDDGGGICYPERSDPFFNHCETDEDCGPGWVCESSSYGTCSDSPCIAGEECPEPVCEEVQANYCVPAPCDSNDDCGPGLICLSFVYEMCSGGGLLPPCIEDDCHDFEPGDFECEEYTEAYCVPPYVAPCLADEDCGPGFECLEAETCWCAGSAGSSTDPTEPDDMTSWEDCGCEPSGTFYCSPIMIECEDNQVCPEDWICEIMPMSSAVPCYFDEDSQETACDDPIISESEGYCLPPYWYGWGASEGDSYYESLNQATGGSSSRPAEVPSVSGPSDDTDTPATSTPSGSSDRSSGGCQLVAGQSATMPLMSLLFLLGLAFLTGRRR